MKDISQELLDACVRGDDRSVRKFLELGADPNSIDNEGRAPLHYAIQGRSVDVVSELLNAGAQIDVADANGNTPLSDAVFYAEGKKETIVYLLERGADPDRENNYGVSPRALSKSIANYDYQDCFK